MIDRSQVSEGMTVFSSDGEKLGKVQRCDATTFTIEKGFFFPKDHVARYDEVSDVSGDDIRLTITKDEFAAMPVASERREQPPQGIRPGEDVRMPVAEEELDVVKRERQAGEVRLRKDVVTETRHVDVPVTREEVHVERAPIAGRHEASPGEARFEEKTISVPVHEEEVEVRKRPVVKEEVRLRKDRVTEQRAADADVRKERIEVEGEEGARVHREEELDTSPRSMGEPRTGSAVRDDEID